MLHSEGEPVLYPWGSQYFLGSCSSWNCVTHSPGRRGCHCGWYKTNLCSVQSFQLLSEVEPLAAGEWQEIFCVSAGVREPGGRYGCRSCSQEITCVSVGVSVGFPWDCVCQSHSMAGPHMKCCLCMQCQDLFQCYISAAHHHLCFIKGCWHQGPDGLSVLD